MHEKALENIRLQVDGLINNCVVHDRHPQFDSIWEQSQAIGRQVLKEKAKWLSPTDVFWIAWMLVRDSLEDSEQREGELSSILGSQQRAVLGERIVAFLVSIPRSYTCLRAGSNLTLAVPLSQPAA